MTLNSLFSHFVFIEQMPINMTILTTYYEPQPLPHEGTA